VLSVVADARLRRRHTPVEFNVKGALWFALVGVCNGAAVLSMYGALALGAVTLVAPTVATYPLFTLLLGRLWLADRLTLRAAAGTALSVIGIGGLLLGR
jgi:uncharacterized membrane protein